MFSSISNTWADLFKRNNSSPSEIVENSSPQCLHEISNDWICVDDQQNCETVDDLKKHEFLTEEQKDRRAQWQKRLQKGRSNKYNSMPSKAKFRKNSNSSPVNNKSEHNNNNSSKVQSNSTSSNQAQLRAKLRLAVEQAGCSNSEQETTNNNNSFPNPNFKPKQAKPVKNNNYNLRSGARKMPIQQPSQRGMN